MEFQYRHTEKRFCVGNGELLRVVCEVPTAEETGELSVFFAFCRETLERSVLFAEETLFPRLCEEYRALPEYDRKFRIPKRVYRVTLCAEETEDETYGPSIRLRIDAALLQKGKREYGYSETRFWAKYGKNEHFLLINSQKMSQNAKKHGKMQKFQHFVHKLVL